MYIQRMKIWVWTCLLLFSKASLYPICKQLIEWSIENNVNPKQKKRVQKTAKIKKNVFFLFIVSIVKKNKKGGGLNHELFFLFHDEHDYQKFYYWVFLHSILSSLSLTHNSFNTIHIKVSIIKIRFECPGKQTQKNNNKLIHYIWSN